MTLPDKHQVIAKINFLETQLSDLNHYLPETYDYLLKELDHQKRILAELDVLEVYAVIENRQDTIKPCS